jgi:hypothetical protein
MAAVVALVIAWLLGLDMLQVITGKDHIHTSDSTHCKI